MTVKQIARRCALACLIACACIVAPGAAGAAAQAPVEAAVKAAYIYRFLEYVAWPAESFKGPEDAITIGVTQEDEIAAELRRIARDRTMQNRKLAVASVRPERDPAVHVLYVAAADVAKLVKTPTRQRPVLIVSDAADGLEHGATINFVQTEGRIKFEVSLEAAQRAGLTISARLLALAVRVKKGEFQRNVFAMSAPVARRPFPSRLVPLLLHLDAATPSRSHSLLPLR
jgi:hypothetical protein